MNEEILIGVGLFVLGTTLLAYMFLENMEAIVKKKVMKWLKKYSNKRSLRKRNSSQTTRNRERKRLMI